MMKKLLPLLLSLLLLTGCASVYDGPTVTKSVLSETVTEGYWDEGDVAYTDRTVYAYDIYGNQAQYIRYNEDEAISRSMFRYDENGNQLSCTEYSLSGWFPRRTSANRYTYDEQGRMLSATYDYSGGDTSHVTWEYDDENRTVTYTYGDAGSSLQYLDENGAVLREEYESDGLTMVTEYTRRPDGQTERCDSFVNGAFDGGYRYEYDDRGRTTAYYSIGKDGTETLQHRWEYDDGHNTVILYNLQSGFRTVTEYNPDGSIAVRQVWDENDKLQTMTLYRYREIRVPAERSETP